MWHWRHRLVWGRRLMAYAVGELSVEQARRMEARLAACVGCRRDVQAYRSVTAALRKTGRVSLTPAEAAAFWPAVEQRIRGEGRRTDQPMRPGLREVLWDHPRLSLASAVTASLLVLGLSLGPLVDWARRPAEPENGVEVMSIEAGDDAPVMLFHVPNSPLKVIWVFEQSSS